jgi:hypothetical protein
MDHMMFIPATCVVWVGLRPPIGWIAFTASCRARTARTFSNDIWFAFVMMKLFACVRGRKAT